MEPEGARTTLRIEAVSRWDALALATTLAHYRWYLLQPDSERWYVCLDVDEPAGELPEDLLRRIRVWAGERQLPSALVHAPDGDHVVETR